MQPTGKTDHITQMLSAKIDYDLLYPRSPNNAKAAEVAIEAYRSGNRMYPFSVPLQPDYETFSSLVVGGTDMLQND